MIQGLYRHSRNERVYEVIDVATDETNLMHHHKYVIYHDVLTGKQYVRQQDEFLSIVNGTQRFSLVTALATRTQLVAATLRMCRTAYLDGVTNNPLFSAKAFKYMVGDKISIYYTLRVISRASANSLLDWVNSW